MPRQMRRSKRTGTPAIVKLGGAVKKAAVSGMTNYLKGTEMMADKIKKVLPAASTTTRRRGRARKRM